MHRLFVAIVPPREIRSRLLAAMGDIPGARWQLEEQLHLTLRFIGEVNRHTAQDVAAALGSLHHPRLTLKLDGVGQFDNKGRVDTMWAGVTPHVPLWNLHNKIGQALAQVGLPAESRAYLPHITLARFPRGRGPAASAAAGSKLLISEPFPVSDFCLFESELGATGATYSIVERYFLA